MPSYGDLAIVKKILRSTDTHDLGSDVEDRFVTLNAAVSSALEEACERTWGAPVADTSELHWAGPYDRIVLKTPARSITSITYGGTLVGTTMTGGTVVLATSLYYPIVDRNGLIYAISNSVSDLWAWVSAWATTVNGALRTPVVVTGDFVSSDNDAIVPDDVKYIVSYMICERLKVEKASSFGAIGPDGTVAPIRDVFADPLVKRVIRKYAREKVLAV